MSTWDRNSDILPTVDADGKRIQLHPSDVRGRFQVRRNRVRWVLILFYLVLPWLTIQGRPGIWIHIPQREFTFFGFLFRAHDTPLLFFPVAAFALWVAWITTLAGRVWCGWACPQTVFIEGVFRWIERRVEGSATQRRKSSTEPQSFSRLFRTSLKWFLFTVFSLLLTHTALALFISSDRVLQILRSSPLENWPAFLFIALSTAVILIDFGWLREQFCLLACPYGRIQSLFLDRHTRTIIYDERRGEPRRGSNDGSKTGDCVSCYRCVQVCPTGIDIRQGAGQLECIACTACIDACDEVMDRLQRPRGLIRYDSENAVQGRKSPWIRPRVVFYALLLFATLGIFAFLLKNQGDVSVTFLKKRGQPYEVIRGEDAAEWIANTFHAEIANRSNHELYLSFSLGAHEFPAKLIAPGNPFLLRAGEVKQTPFVVEIPRHRVKDGRALVVLEWAVKETENAIKTRQEELPIVGPFR